MVGVTYTAVESETKFKCVSHSECVRIESLAFSCIPGNDRSVADRNNSQSTCSLQLEIEYNNSEERQMMGVGCCCGSGLCSLYKPINICWMSMFAPSQRHLKTSVSSLNHRCNDKMIFWVMFMCEEEKDLGCDSLLAPLCSNSSCGAASCWCRAQTQEFTPSLCLAALPAPLFTASLHNPWCCTRRGCKIPTPRTYRCASQDVCRANPAPTKGFTDAAAVTGTLMFNKKVESKQIRDINQSLMSLQSLMLQFFAPTESLLLTFPAPLLFTCKLAFSSATVPCSFMCKR